MTLRQQPETVATNLPTALIVEPVPALARFLKGLMREIGFRVQVVEGPDEALAEIQNANSPIDLVVSEFSMPYLTGPRLAQFIRRQRPSLPVILLCDQPVPERVTRQSNALLLEKPFTRDQMASLLRNLSVLAA